MLSKELKLTKFDSLEPCPFLVRDNFLDEKIAQELQKEILALPLSDFDRYANPFEDKYTLLKKNFPLIALNVIKELESTPFVSELEKLCNGVKLSTDSKHQQYWGIHLYTPGDRLSIHVDAGIHPFTKQRKIVTLCIYLSYKWNVENSGHLEFWSGDSAEIQEPKIDKCLLSVAPMFNRLVLFLNTDKAWHGNPQRTPFDDKESRRIILTLSYMMAADETLTYSPSFLTINNKRERAYFAAIRNVKESDEERKLRELRSKSETCAGIYNMKK